MEHFNESRGKARPRRSNERDLLGKGAAARAPHGEVTQAFLRGLLDALDHGADEVTTQQLLDDLASYLRLHFAAEEGQDGLFDRLAAAAPWSCGRVERLRTEHATLLGELERVRAKLLPATGEMPSQVLGELRALLEALRGHEAAEEDLLQECFDRDVGGPG